MVYVYVSLFHRLNLDSTNNTNQSSGSTLQNVVSAATDIGALSTKFSSFRKDIDDTSRQHVPTVLIDEVLTAKKVMMVVVIGGISYLEIAAFRFLSNDPNFPYKIILASTKVINGSTFLGSMYHTF